MLRENLNSIISPAACQECPLVQCASVDESGTNFKPSIVHLQQQLLKLITRKRVMVTFQQSENAESTRLLA